MLPGFVYLPSFERAVKGALTEEDRRALRRQKSELKALAAILDKEK